MPFNPPEVPTKHPTTGGPLGHAGTPQDFWAVYGQVAGPGQSEEHGLLLHHVREIRARRDAPRMVLEHCKGKKNIAPACKTGIFNQSA